MNFIRGMNPAESLILGKWSKVGNIEIYFKSRIKINSLKYGWSTILYSRFKLSPPYRENFQIYLKHEEQRALKHRKKFEKYVYTRPVGDKEKWRYEIIILDKNNKKIWGQNRYLKDII